MPRTAVVIGASAAGLTTAIALERQGWACTIIEASPDYSLDSSGIILHSNALKALEQLHIAHEVAARGRVISSISIQSQSGRILSNVQANNLRNPTLALHRKDLHRELRRAIGPTQIVPNREVVRVSQLDHRPTVWFSDGSGLSTDLVVVTDGIHSTVRKQFISNVAPRYAGYTAWHSIAFAPEINVEGAVETWGKQGRLGVVPLGGGRIYWYACVNAEEHSAWAGSMTIEDLRERFRAYQSPLPDILNHTSHTDVVWGNVYTAPPLERLVYNRVVLLGDSAFATTPSLGQGASVAIEDAVVLATELARTPSIDHALASFDRRRVQEAARTITISHRVAWAAQRTDPIMNWIRDWAIQRMRFG